MKTIEDLMKVKELLDKSKEDYETWKWKRIFNKLYNYFEKEAIN
ncbi:MAG: hypothetical protein R6V12_15165 [Candidatus Hydrogenedentota bacterium]